VHVTLLALFIASTFTRTAAAAAAAEIIIFYYQKDLLYFM
jgi:hypothetical protein